MTIAQGINKVTSYKKQSALGTPASGSGGQILRRETSQSLLAVDTYTNNEIVSHQQSTGVSIGLRKPSFKLNGVLSAGTYSAFLGSLLRKDFAAGVSASSVSLTIAGSGPYTVTRAAGDYLTDGFKVGKVIRLSVGALHANNINKNLLITNLTSTVATVVVLNDSVMTAEGPITGCTVAVVGKVSLVPTTGHTNDYYTIEDWHSDISRSILTEDVQIAKADISMPGSGNITIAFEGVGLDQVPSGTRVLTTPTAETTTGVLTANSSAGILQVNGTTQANVTSLSLSIDGNTAPLGAVVGTNVSPDIQRGRVKVTGQFAAYFQDGTLSGLFDAGTVVDLIFVASEDTTATSDFISITLHSLKLTSDTDDDGEKALIRTFAFEAEYNGAGGSGIKTDQTIIAIQDSAA